jgi:hypothetical protein
VVGFMGRGGVVLPNTVDVCIYIYRYLNK